MPLTQSAQAVLNTYHAGKLQNEIAFHKALGQVGLDYTPDSLTRIDRLLRQMHAKLSPQPDVFIGVKANASFLYLLSYYVGTLIGRFTLQRVEWYTPDELPKVFPGTELEKLEACFQTTLTCVFFRDGERTGFFLPLAPICDVLFSGDPSSSVAASAGAYLRRAITVPILRPLLTGIGTPAKPSEELGEAVHRLGLLIGSQVAWACRTALEAGSSPAELTDEYTNGQRQITSLIFMGPDTAFAIARQRLEDPDEGVAGTVFAYDGNINLSRFRTDALIMEARWHSPKASATIAVPYRHADKPGGFALFLPRVIESSFTESHLPVLEAAFFAGIDSVNPPGLWAERHLGEDDPDNLAARLAEQAAAAYPVPLDPFADIRLDAIDVAANIAALPPDQADYAEIALPPWASEDALAESINDVPALLREGRIVWGQLIQANSRMFETGSEDGLPGDVLYDPTGQWTPAKLGPIARALFASRKEIATLRADKSAPPEFLRLAEHFENGMSRARALRVPAVDGHDGLLVSSVYFARQHLPAKKLSLSVFPLLILDRRPGSVMVLPSRWWPQDLLTMWSDFVREQRRDEWQKAWAQLASGRDEKDEERWQIELAAVKDYARHGVDDRTVSPYMSLIDADGSQKDSYSNGFRPGIQPAPREWEWGLDGRLASMAEYQTRAVEGARARGQGLDLRLARLAYAMRHTAQMINLHTCLLAGQRGCSLKNGVAISPDEIQWAALGLVAGCEQPALNTARTLCAAWRYPEYYFSVIRPEVRAVFILFARQLGVFLPELEPFKPLPALDALLANDRWLDPDANTLAPLIEAACVEHTEEAPNGPFRGLPIAIVLILKLRAMRGLANPTVTHPLLAVPLGDWATPVGFDDCFDPLLHAVRDRLKKYGFDDKAIAAAIINGSPLHAPDEFARPALAATHPSLAEEPAYNDVAESGSRRYWRALGKLFSR